MISMGFRVKARMLRVLNAMSEVVRTNASTGFTNMSPSMTHRMKVPAITTQKNGPLLR